MKWWNKLKKLVKPTIVSFACTRGGYYVSTPIQLARQLVPEWMKEQARKHGKAKFVRCPGMHDLLHQGFLINAHSDIHIKVTKHNVMVDMPLVSEHQLKPSAMDYAVVEGIAPIPDGIPKHVCKIPMPWGIHMPPGYSAHVLPAFFHSNFHDKLWVYPGTVDYDDFHTINCIFSPIKECDFVIPAGTPLVQILPFKREDFLGTSGPATQLESDRLIFGFPSRVLGYYRRKLHKKKTYTIEVTK